MVKIWSNFCEEWEKKKKARNKLTARKTEMVSTLNISKKSKNKVRGSNGVDNV